MLNVFQDGTCHPKMAMVIDDRLKVWEDKDQPRVHVVPAFTPYYAPQAEVPFVLYDTFDHLPDKDVLMSLFFPPLKDCKCCSCPLCSKECRMQC